MKQHIQVKANRLFFIDGIRAWAILMMLQGHFIDGLLAPVFRDTAHWVYRLWLYGRGCTAPVFFTVSGFVFSYLLIQGTQVGRENPRVKKGIRRGVQLLLIGYILRLNGFGLLQGQLYDGFYMIDVLHCIGLSLIGLVGLYQCTAHKKSVVFFLLLTGVTFVLFLLEPIYRQFSYSFLPTSFANYFTKSGGSVFTIFPWLGYATAGGALAVLFTRFKNVAHFYCYAIGIAMLLGYGLVFHSSDFFIGLYTLTELSLFHSISTNNYLFIRLGDVFLIFAFFMAFRHFLTSKTVVKIGANTLSIYVVHFILLYGSFTGWGVYQLFHHALSPATAILGALAFMVGCTWLALLYIKYEKRIKGQLLMAVQKVKEQPLRVYKALLPVGNLAFQVKWFVQRRFIKVRN